MACLTRRGGQVIAYVTVSLVGLAEALLLHTLWLPPAYFGVIPGGLFLLITCMDAYLALIGVELHIQVRTPSAVSKQRIPRTGCRGLPVQTARPPHATLTPTTAGNRRACPGC